MFTKYFAIICAVILGALVGLFLWSAYEVIVLGRADIHAENGLIENLQVVSLAIACIVFLVPVALEKRSDKLILLFFAWLCFSFILREVDFKNLNVYEAVKLLGSRAGRIAVIAPPFILMLCYAAFWFSYYKKAAIKFVLSQAGALLIAGGVLVITGSIFDHQSWIPYHEYFEEMFELVGYISILLAAFAV